MNMPNTIRDKGPAVFFVLALVFLTVLYSYLIYHTGWISDDARITFTYVENVLRGEGAVFNDGQRVQAYTHTLWFLTLTLSNTIWHNVVQTTYILSFVFSLAAYLAIFVVAGQKKASTLFLAGGLLLSVGFIDYSTSGLENALSYLLFALFILVLIKRTAPRSVLFLLASLIYLNRPDLVLIVFPILLKEGFQLPNWKDRLIVPVLGFLPLILWTIFSLVYYGVPFPNTAYAKLGTGIAKSDLIMQGLRYFEASWRYDPITILILAFSLPLALFYGRLNQRLLSAGLVCYLAYIVWIGGDFMLSRHLAVPAYLAILLVAWIAPVNPFARIDSRVLLLVALSFIGFVSLYSNAVHLVESSRVETGFFHGISDERIFWQRNSNLRKEVERGLKSQPIAKVERTSDDKAIPKVKAVCGWLGVLKLMERKTVWVDRCALTDPLLARIPALTLPSWRIGHFERPIPLGYIDAVRRGTPLYDSVLEKYERNLQILTHDEIFSVNRFLTIAKFNLDRQKTADAILPYRLDITRLQKSKENSMQLLSGRFEWSDLDHDESDMTWIVEMLQEKPHALLLELERTSALTVVFEYINPVGFEIDREKYWEQVDYHIAVVAKGDQGLAVEMELPKKDSRMQLKYIHILSDQSRSISGLKLELITKKVSI